ncbi:MAG TPA: sigma-70 family RNA polymerase sigma factor [Kofleriaceae bacterium]|nr:sigma-70 family RNA polymerase sigma factor [Kofleriaceae bacterium]
MDSLALPLPEPQRAASTRAIAEAVRAHDALLLATARKLCRNAADADDLVHDTYERALRSWDRYDERGNVKSWLMAILHNLFIDRCRRARRDPRTTPVELCEVATPEPAPAPAWASVTGEHVARALAAIGRDFREVYELHAAGRSYDEIAAELSIAKATVGTRLLRARKKLKDALVRELEQERS